MKRSLLWLAALTGCGMYSDGLGPPGDTGATGPPGAEGMVGARGDDGATGQEGMAGATGLPGEEGATGATGVNGANGGMGIGGDTGPMGATGVAGTVGATGVAGATGPEGATGVAGATGPEGATGVAGATGREGDTGPAGATGGVGATGAPGLLQSGTVSGATPYWNGASWVVSNNFLYRSASSVGVNTTTPAGLLTVGGSAFVTHEADVSQTATNQGASGGNYWQSFTGATSGYLAGLDIFVRSSRTGGAAVLMMINLYQGEGTSGTLLSQQSLIVSGSSFAWHSVDMASAPPVTAGTQYTFEVIPTIVQVFWNSFQTGNAYAGGRMSFDPAYDATFVTYVTPESDPTVLSVGEHRVGIGTSQPDVLLEVNGEARFGSRSGQASTPGYGTGAVILSGGPVLGSYSGDNSDPMWLARYNAAVDNSQLRVNVGDAPDDADRFVVGYTSGNGGEYSRKGTWTPRVSVSAAGHVRAAGTITASTTPDIAETISAASDVEAGDAVCADPLASERVRRCANGDQAVMGVVSDGTSAFIINAYARDPDAPLSGAPLVLAGRVPVKVSLENGPIAIGDWLAPSSIPGVVMHASAPGPVIGLALEAFDGSGGRPLRVPTVLCFVSPGQSGIAALVDENAKMQTALRKLEADHATLEATLRDVLHRLERLEEQ